ncbi:hypothetical protein G6F56_002550 [Rhizopus delemar]|nr:hypothetical protein G6F56_002550 [Rhizopus delemar]
MLDSLVFDHPNILKKQVEIAGYAHAGLFCQVLRVNGPSPYITRVTRLGLLSISSYVYRFGAVALPSLYKRYIVRKIVLSVQNACNIAAASPSTHCQNSS